MIVQRAFWLSLSLVFLGCPRGPAPTPEPKYTASKPMPSNEGSPVPRVLSLAPFEGSWELSRFQDLDPTPSKIEVNLEAKPTEYEYLPGKKAEVWAYNGSIPGPLLEANVGDEVTVHFKNSLPEATTVHWHGLQLPAAMDGSPAVQNPIKPNETFEYKFTLKHAGLFWFHPHVRSDKQVEKGLYGVILVHDKSEPNFNAIEKVLVLDDVLLNDTGDLQRFIPPGPMAMGGVDGTMNHMQHGPDSQPDSKPQNQADSQPSEASGYVCPMHPQITSEKPGKCQICLMDLVPDTGHHEMMMSPDDMEGMIGRHGNVILVNGKPRPVMTLRAGARYRLRMVNTANSRYFRLSLPGYKLTLIGVDGGLLEASRELEELLLAPGERADVIVEATGKPGDEIDLVTLAYARGHGLGKELPAEVLHLRYSKEAPIDAVPPLPKSMRTIDGLPIEGAKTKTLRLSESMGPEGVAFYINSEAYPKVTQLTSKLGEVEVWEVINESEMDHPFHLHGFFFQAIDRDGIAEPYRAWKDTINIPGKHRLRFAVKFDGFAGRWMYHCHILEHGERGMMGELIVEP